MRWYPGQATDEITERESRIRAVARKAAAEGMVLLENNGILPLRAGMKIALYGQGARYTIKGGTGSGDVNSRNTVHKEPERTGSGNLPGGRRRPGSAKTLSRERHDPAETARYTAADGGCGGRRDCDLCNQPDFR